MHNPFYRHLNIKMNYSQLERREVLLCIKVLLFKFPHFNLVEMK